MKRLGSAAGSSARPAVLAEIIPSYPEPDVVWDQASLLDCGWAAEAASHDPADAVVVES